MATDEFAPIAITLKAVVVNVTGLTYTESPLATSIVPLLVKVIDIM